MTTTLLAGLRIVEGSAFVAAPSAGMTLAQLGAEVIRFDQIGGGLDFRRWPVTSAGESLYWAGLNKGKRSIAIDLRSPEGQELLSDLITAPGPDAGIFLTNFPPRGWMSYEALSARRPDLVMVVLAGNHDGSSAVDYTVNCAVGYPDVTGPVDSDQPVNHVLPAWDLITGQSLVAALLGAERHRLRTGAGQLATVALSDVALHAVATLGHVAEAQINGTERGRYGNDLYGAFGRDFPTADGRRVMVAAISPKQWESLVAATGCADPIAALEGELGVTFRSEGARFDARDRIAELIEPWIARHTLRQVATAFDAGDVLWGPYQSFGQLVGEDPRCTVANPMFDLLDQPGIGSYLTPGSPVAFSGVDRASVAPAPRLGEHTEQVLARVLGLTSAQIGDLHDRRIVASAPSGPASSTA